ncbi:dynamin family protein [Bacillus sp. BRMEA1]|uniref:dynamin family protein n=1 Tax=Neobacillus endophyticus TaxID=2738405 RepID=UPI00156516DC|nr:dynamin family protein [Neobacillus endophyticus]NRD80514.1 dynamin family protein [Neobacillus endophyticus]
MIKTTNPDVTTETLKNTISSLYSYFIEHSDVESAGKVKQLAKKLVNREFTIAFCGHFSAGKSTMINRVIGENLLPSSPIPTSANLVKVKSGEDYAKVFFKNEKPRLYLAPYDYELVKKYCKDGDQIEEIEISYSHSNLPANTVIMDTPGIDSADDAHRIATESAIHLADLIFYVMDYNHVQAELNFLFTKELTEAGKEVYLVINQIDKHKDEELSFQEFQNSVVSAFASWGVTPARIFYTSLKQPEHPRNEFTELQTFIGDKLVSKDEFLLDAIYHSLKKVAQDHLIKTRKSGEEKLFSSSEIIGELTAEEREVLKENYENMAAELQNSTIEKGEGDKEFDDEISQILKNSYLMPFQTRELAERYLESCQSEFKVGFLFSKQKTVDERNARFENFYHDILEKTKSQLEWHLREYLLNTLKKEHLDQGELLSAAQSFSVSISKDVMLNAVKPGARLSGEYVLHYTEDVANAIKKAARNQIEKFKPLYLEEKNKQNAKILKQMEQDFSETERYMRAVNELELFEQMMQKEEQLIDKILKDHEVTANEHANLFEQEDEDCEVVKSQPAVEPIKAEGHDSLEAISTAQGKHENFAARTEERLKLTIQRLQDASSLIKELPGFKKLANELVEKAERLNHKSFTVALFGAFSAGKSSFANALMGEKVLPVSPNPTTAAINKIKPVTDEYHHGTAVVKFKSQNAMLDDVNRSLKVFALQAADLTSALKLIDRIMVEKSQEGVNEKTHFAFLQAFMKGFELYSPLLGTLKETNLSEFHEFVAKEEKSCYVEWIELYYDCELTRKGITLVDTPGADSINARHTGVAFDYIKNSDAILFVTYYNHAFSKADREFLIQLGRVKESFQLDKMFFIINAIDLAENAEEQEAVVEYVREQLKKYAIRNPHLFPLSSLLALQEKLEHQALSSGMMPFEDQFYQFISNDLTEMAVTAAEKELDRVHDLVLKLIQSSQEDQSVKEQRRAEMVKQQAAIHNYFTKLTSEHLQHRFTQEAEELVFYIKQRVFFRFSDFFKESFNPSTLRDDGRNLKKAVQGALEEFLDSLGYDLAQELRATTVRLDRFVEKLFSDYQASLGRNLSEINQDLSYSDFEKNKFVEIEFPSAFSQINRQLFAKALSYFKNPRSFFEKDEKTFMMEELEKTLSPLADQYLKDESGRLKQHYLSEVEREYTRLLSLMIEQTEDYYLSLFAAMDGGVSVERLLEIQKELKG